MDYRTFGECIKLVPKGIYGNITVVINWIIYEVTENLLENCMTRIGNNSRSIACCNNSLSCHILFEVFRFYKSVLIKNCPIFYIESACKNNIVKNSS